MVNGTDVHIILNDSTFLYSHKMVDEHLQSLGYNLSELEDHFSGCSANEKIEHYKEVAEEWELQSDTNYNNLIGMYNELEELVDKLREGKGGTKKQMADRMKKVMDYYVN